jgi:hypothetical protein
VQHDLDAWFAQCGRPAPGPSIYESSLSVEAELVWLRFMVQLWRESAVTGKIRSHA